MESLRHYIMQLRPSSTVTHSFSLVATMSYSRLAPCRWICFQWRRVSFFLVVESKKKMCRRESYCFVPEVSFNFFSRRIILIRVHDSEDILVLLCTYSSRKFRTIMRINITVSNTKVMRNFHVG